MSSGFVPSLITFLGTTGGRDKACRLLQYLMRLTAARTRANAVGQVNKADLIQRAVKMESLGSSMAMTRKVLRFGRPIGILMNIQKTLNDLIEGKVLNGPKAIFSILSSVSLMLFFLLDHYLYFARLGISNNSSRKARVDYLSNLFWLLECIFGILKNLTEYLEAKETCSRSELQKKTKELAVDTARNLLDIPVAIGFMYEGKIASDKMGLLGAITSLIGIYQIWK